MSDRPCVIGCQVTRTLDDGTTKRVPRLTESGYLCDPCRDRLDSWLANTGIPEDYALLGFVALPGSVEKAPGSKTGKRADPPAPVRVEVLDLVDDRQGWRSDGTTDGRGVLGLIESWGRLVREERGMRIPTAPATLTGECAFLHKQLDWLCSRPWIDEMYHEIRAAARELSTAIGYPWPQPIGRCPELDCGEPLWMPPEGANAVICGKCGAQWKRERWLLLADVIESEAAS